MILLSEDELHELLATAAGIGAGGVMQTSADAPGDEIVMPTELIAEAVKRLWLETLLKHGAELGAEQ